MVSVLAYLIHVDPWMALAAFGLFIPQLVFVPLLQSAVNLRTGARIQVLRRLGIAMIDRNDDAEDNRRIDEAFALDMGIFKLKFTMNFLMNACNHLQRISAFLVGGWWVYTGHLEIGGVVAFISGLGRLNDPWAIWSTTSETSTSRKSNTGCWLTPLISWPQLSLTGRLRA